MLRHRCFGNTPLNVALFSASFLFHLRRNFDHLCLLALHWRDWGGGFKAQWGRCCRAPRLLALHWVWTAAQRVQIIRVHSKKKVKKVIDEVIDKCLDKSSVFSQCC
jgi:hypothetical protein